MRISDWSSDVCSSDLYLRRSQPPLHPGTAVRSASSRPAQVPLPSGEGGDPLAARPAERLPLPSALPACHRSLPRRAAGPSRNRGRALVRLPSQRLTMAEKEHDQRSTERRVGKESVRTGRYRWPPYNKKKKK